MSKPILSYPGLALTTIDVTPKIGTDVDELKTGDKVTFTRFDLNGTRVVFLKNIEQFEKDGPFEAEFLTSTDAANFVKTYAQDNQFNSDTTPLFCVHGFNTQPADKLKKTLGVLNRFEEAKVDGKSLIYYPIPVIWPSSDGGNVTEDYDMDQQNPTQNAGKGLKAFVDGVDNKLFPRKSLMMHSMGNHVVFNGACGQDTAPDVQFENIFMVAADIPKDIFYNEPYEYDDITDEEKKERKKSIFGNKRSKADKLIGMLAKDSNNGGAYKGKIYVVYNPNDLPLHGSGFWFVNNETRIGRVGHDNQGSDDDKVRDEFKDVVEAKHITPDLPWFGDDWFLGHSYQFETTVIKFYFEKALK